MAGLGARAGMALLAVGALLVAPHPRAVADSDESVTPSVSERGVSGGPADSPKGPRTQRGSLTQRPDGARADAEGSRRAGVPSPTATVSPSRKHSSRISSMPGQVRRPAPPAGSVVGPAQKRAVAAQQALSASPEPPAATAAPQLEPPNAGVGTAGSVGTVGEVFGGAGGVANLIDAGLNFLNGLPANPITDFVSGALLLARRDLDGVPAAGGPVGLVSASQTNQTFVVSTLADAGAGSLRQAIIDANAAAGADQITFAVAGAIAVGATALPAITDATVIDASTAPGYAGAPVVRIDYQNTEGLTLATGASGSRITALSLVDAAGAGVTIAASGTRLTGNYIGLWGNGSTVEANRGDGVLVLAGASENLIGVGVEEAFALSNVISGNRGNGITILGDDNIVQANYIGTSSSGVSALANCGNGVQITAGASGNTIGGTASGGNNPTADPAVIVRPPQGNLISGNRGNGVLIDDGATGNTLSGNFIGTNPTGDAPLGNRQDGVAIVNADGNGLIGTTSLEAPFIYYNVVSGNCGNGLRITNSDRTTVHADFFGISAFNDAAVPNGGNGVLVEGNSRFVDLGGQIPLGNVMSGNRGFGIEIAGTSGGVTSFNSFVGQAAFKGAVPNRAGGIRVTSSNPGFDPNDALTWIRIRTSLIGGNLGNGIEFLGNAHGAEVTDTAIGTNYKIEEPLSNIGNGIVIGGNASQIAIGGFQPSVQQFDGGFSVHIGANGGTGIVFEDNAHDSTVFNTRVGLGIGATIPDAYKLPNRKGGITVGPGTSGIVIGGPLEPDQPNVRFINEIGSNIGDGVSALLTLNLGVFGNTIAGNTGSGLSLVRSPQATVGAPLAGNTIEANDRYGVFALGNLAGSTVQASTIRGNGGSGMRLAWARGITVGGVKTLEPNAITANDGWGVYAAGWSAGSVLSVNVTADNARGGVNTRWAFGLTTI